MTASARRCIRATWGPRASRGGRCWWWASSRRTDSIAAATSGSAYLVNLKGVGSLLEISQCVAVQPESQYQLGGALAWEIGARRAWGLDIHARCVTTIAALKLARSLMADDPTIDTILIGGGYAISHFIDLGDVNTSFLFNIGAGAGAMIVKRDWPENRVLGTHLIADGMMSRHVLVPASGSVRHPDNEAVACGGFKFRLVEPEAMKARLGEVSIPNWLACVDKALGNSGTKPDGSPYQREDIDFFNMSLVKPSAHREMLQHLGLTEEQSVYISDIGHIGEQDAIINIEAGVEQGRLKPGDTMVIIAAGIGYVWGGAVVEWGPKE